MLCLARALERLAGFDSVKGSLRRAAPALDPGYPPKSDEIHPLEFQERPFSGPEVLSYAARIYVLVGDRDAAIAALQELSSIPAGLWVSPAMLRLDPAWDSIRSDPRFIALTKQSLPDTTADATAR